MAINKTIVVSGGAGFLGSHLCAALCKQECTVICVDNLFTGRKKNIEALRKLPNFTFINHDIIEPLYLDNYMIDEIYHLACPASPPAYQQNAIRTIKANVLGTINMLGLAKKHKARILLSSTSEIYGDPEVHPQVEEYRGCVNPIGIRSCYDEGKRCAETLMFDYQRQNDVDIRVVRIFNTYGPHMDPNDGRVVSNFIMQALRNEDITIYGDGTQTRSFCFVADLIRAIISMMNQEKTFGPVNIGNPNEFTIKELAEKVISLTGATSKVLYRELPSDDPTRRKPDISKAKQYLAWEPKIELEEGLGLTIPYFKEYTS